MNGERLNRSEWEVRTAPLATVRALVEAHHYARGGSNTAVYRHGLYRRGSEELMGAAWWLPPTKRAAESVTEDWKACINLTRLVVHPDAPTNAASYLLGASMRLILRDGRFHTLLTYADTGQGHMGTIYEATNWEFVGETSGEPVFIDSEGRQVSRKSGPVSRSHDEMEALGYTNLGRSPKRKFVYRFPIKAFDRAQRDNQPAELDLFGAA